MSARVGWSFTSVRYHGIKEGASRGWNAQCGEWVDYVGERPPTDHIPCSCAPVILRNRDRFAERYGRAS